MDNTYLRYVIAYKVYSASDIWTIWRASFHAQYARLLVCWLKCSLAYLAGVDVWLNYEARWTIEVKEKTAQEEAQYMKIVKFFNFFDSLQMNSKLKGALAHLEP